MAYEDENFIDSTKMVWNYSLFTKKDIKLFADGEHFYAHQKFGSHKINVLNSEGFYFAVWAQMQQRYALSANLTAGKKIFIHYLCGLINPAFGRDLYLTSQKIFYINT